MKPKLARIAEDTAAIRASVERMEARGEGMTSARVIPRQLPPKSLSRYKVSRDAELRDFVIERAQEGTHEVKEIHAAAIERFGRQRVPACSSLYRFVTALRKEVKGRS